MYSTRSSYLKISNSKIDSIVEKETRSAILFVVHKKRLLFVNINNVDGNGIKKGIKTAKESIKMLQPKEDYYGIAEGPFKYPKKPTHDRYLEEYSQDFLIDTADSAINGSTANSYADVAGTVHVSFTESELATSRGAHAKNKNTMLRISLRAFRDDLSFQDFAIANKASLIDTEAFGERISDTLSSVKRIGKIKRGKYDVVYTQSPGGSLCSNVNAFSCVSSIETGSPFTGKLNRHVANKNITIYDAKNENGAVEASPYDDEGFPTRKVPVIENGTLKNYLHNYSTAKKYNTKSTGNAGLVNPQPGMMVFNYKRKVAGIEDLISKMDKGIVVTNTWYTRFSNYLTGDFSTVPRDLALYIERGEPKFAIKQGKTGAFLGIRISDNLIRMLNNIDSVADDSIQSTSWDAEGDYYFMPSSLVKDAEVTTA